MRNQVWKTALSAGLIALASVGAVIGVEPFERFRSVSAQEMRQDAEQTITGRLGAESETAGDGSYYNVHILEAEAGQTFLIEMVSNEFDTYLMVFDAEGNKLAENNDDNNGTNAQVSVTIPATGQYAIIANSLDAGETGDYTLTIQAIQAEAISQESNQLDAKAEADRLLQQGIQQYRVSQFREALSSWEAALQIYREINDRQGEANALGNLGNAYFSLGQYETAIDFHEQQLAIAREIGDRQGEANALGNLGNAYLSLGQYETAIDYHEQSLAIAREIGDRQGEANSLGNLGNVYDSLRNYPRAVDYLEVSLAIAREIGYRKGEANALNSLGSAYRSLGEYQRAIDYHERAITIFREIGDRQGEADSLGSLGSVYAKLGDHLQAIDYLEASLTIAREIGYRQGEASALSGLGDVYFSQEDHPRTIAYYEQTLTIAREIGDLEGEANVLNNLGFIFYHHMQLYAEAEDFLYAALGVLETLRDPNLPDTDKVSLFETQSKTYYLLQQLLVAQTKTHLALEIAERSRARSLLDLLTDQVSERTATELILDLPSLSEIQRIAQQQNATLVSYSFIDFQDQDPVLYIWIIQPTGEISFEQTDLTTIDQPLSELITFSRSTIGARSRNNNATIVASLSPEAKQQQQQSLKQLYDILIAPITNKLPTDENDRVIFIPQGELFLVPFAALIDENNQYLIENHTISISPSIQALALTNQLSNPNASLIANPLIVGNPTMPKRKLWNPNTYTEVEIELSSLPGAENEARAIAQQLKTDALLHDNASETIVAERMQTASLIHLATHGLRYYADFTPETGFQEIPGAIALAPDSANDGFLTSAEIFAMQLQAELVVLSACDTGRGTITSDGVIGLSRSLMQAGVPSVVVSLWSVPDDSTEFLMKEFYANLDEMDKVQALRQAMLTTMQNPEYAEPLDWAAFTLVGEPE